MRMETFEIILSGVSMFKYKTFGDFCQIDGLNVKGQKVVTIPETINRCWVVSIGPNAFRDNPDLEEIYIPDTIGQIYEYAFNNCYNLRKVHFYSVKNSAKTKYRIYLYKAVFEFCTKLEEITFDEFGRVACMLDEARQFKDCHKLRVIEAEFDYHVPGYAFHNCYEINNLVFRQEILNGVTFNRTSLTRCKNLKTIIINGNLDSYTADNVVNKLKKIHIICPANSNIAKTFPNVTVTPKIELPTDFLKFL